MELKIDESKKRVLGFKKKPEELRKRVSLAFTTAEFKQLDEVADQYHLSRSEFVRCVIFGGLDKAAKKVERINITEHEKQLKRILASISNNLNQITRRVHISDANKINIDEVARIVDELKAALKD